MNEEQSLPAYTQNAGTEHPSGEQLLLLEEQGKSAMQRVSELILRRINFALWRAMAENNQGQSN